jgi:hypothetical protein
MLKMTKLMRVSAPHANSAIRICNTLSRRRLQHDPEKACPRLNPDWGPVSRLREAVQADCVAVSRFGGRRQVRKDHAQTRS